MADDLTDAEADIQAMQGIDNHPLGFAILRPSGCCGRPARSSPRPTIGSRRSKHA
jgi:hypothetical protein